MKGTFSTEIGLLGIWDSASMSFVKTPDDGMKYMVGDELYSDHMTKGFGVFWGTGGDGTYDVDIRVGADAALSPEERAIIEMKAENNKLVVTGERVIVGSPEYVGFAESEGLMQKRISLVQNIQPGTYAVDLYFIYDGEAEEKMDDMSRAEVLALPEGFDKTGFVVLLKSVDTSHQFPPKIFLPTLG